MPPMSEAVRRRAALFPRRLLHHELRLVYTDALARYVTDGSEASRRQACDIARWAIAQRITVVRTAAIHHEALGRILSRHAGVGTFKERLRRATEFFGEVLSVYWPARRGFREPAPIVRELNDKMECQIRQ